MNMHRDTDDTPPKGTPTLHQHHTRIGRRMADTQLSFLGAKDRIVMWLVAGLVSWLCYSTMMMRESMVLMVERSSSFKEQIAILYAQNQQLQLADAAFRAKLEEVQLQQAEHGWKRAGQ